LGIFLVTAFTLPVEAKNLLCGSKASVQSARCKALTNANTEETKIGTAWSSERSGFGRFE
jgi:hypothetical protein